MVSAKIREGSPKGRTKTDWRKHSRFTPLWHCGHEHGSLLQLFFEPLYVPVDDGVQQGQGEFRVRVDPV